MSFHRLPSRWQVLHFVVEHLHAGLDQRRIDGIALRHRRLACVIGGHAADIGVGEAPREAP